MEWFGGLLENGKGELIDQPTRALMLKTIT